MTSSGSSAQTRSIRSELSGSPGTIARAPSRSRVASANERFSGFPRGWKSDRGQVWIVLGRPDGISAGGLRSEVWTYNTYGGILKSSSVMGQMEVGFVQVDVGSWEIAGGVGPGAWPAYVLNAFRIVNQAVIANPELEWK